MIKSLPTTFKPELATLTETTPNSKEWIHEIKFDGYRLLCFITEKSIKLFTRNGNDWSNKFPEIIKSLKLFPKKNTILDGELVVLDRKGISHFQLLQNALEGQENDNVHLFIFDMPYWNGNNITTETLLNRKEKLKLAFNLWKHPHDNIILTQYIIGLGEKVYKTACRKKLEGIISKNITSHYIQKRTKDWLKTKCSHRQEFVIGGFTKPKRSRKYFGALLLGFYDRKKFIYCGKVGTGFSGKILADLYKKMNSIIIDKCPFNDKSKIDSLNQVIWIKPKLIAEVSFTEWTNDGRLRHPSYIGLRQDKMSTQVKKDA